MPTVAAATTRLMATTTRSDAVDESSGTASTGSALTVGESEVMTAPLPASTELGGDVAAGAAGASVGCVAGGAVEPSWASATGAHSRTNAHAMATSVPMRSR